jgi:hypothetical protein
MLASLLLRAVSPRYAAVVLADLRESVPPHRFFPELLRSLPPLLAAELCRAHHCRTAGLLVLFSSFVAPVLLDAAWSLILSQVPLKAGLERDADFLVLQLLLTALLALLAGTACSLRGLLLAIPATAVLTAAALSIARGGTPGWLPVALTFTSALFMALGAQRFRRLT